jgi:hypothetical protein
MQKYKKPKFDYNKLGVNPCASSSLIITVNEIAFKDFYMQDEDGILLPAKKEVEATPFTKLYVTAERRLIVAKLSPAAKELFLWVMLELDSGKDALWINKDRFMEENNTSLNTFKKAIDELIRYAFLAYTVVREVYWINPDFFFKGDRISKYPKNIKHL